ncbi:FG-GAP repeat protein [delta proteobacterium NaphS2]|nr:FG-GAP repeat protein [delta proteobacterium NaphS2]
MRNRNNLYLPISAFVCLVMLMGFGQSWAQDEGIGLESSKSLAIEAFQSQPGTQDATVLDADPYCRKGTCWYAVKVGDREGRDGQVFFVSLDGQMVLAGWDALKEFCDESAMESDEAKIDSVFAASLSAMDPSEWVRILIILKGQPDIDQITQRAAKAAVEGSGDDEKVANYQQDTQVYRSLVSQYASTSNEAHGQGEVASQVELLGGEIYLRGTLRNHLGVKVRAGDVEQIAADPQVERIEPDREAHGHLNVSIPTIGANAVWASYTDGYDNTKFMIDIGIMDSGVGDSDGHPNLNVYSSYNFDYPISGLENYTYDNQGHGTHVAGITSSNHATYRGVAYGANLRNLKIAHYNSSTGGASGSFSAAMNALDYAYDNWFEVVNYSYGWYPPDDGLSYTDYVDGDEEISRTFDAYAQAGLTCVVSAGNEGSSYSTIGVPGDAFNVLTVGNMYDHGTTSRSDDTLWTSSSRGYTGDGRTKPEVAAPGTSIYSCNYSTDGFVNMTGTSMAAPHVAGLVAMVTDYWAILYNQRISANGDGSVAALLRGGPLAVRAMVMNMADETTGESTGSMNDRQTGAGYINAKATMPNVKRTNVVIGDVAYHQFLWYSVTVPAGQTVKATLVWNRHVNMSTKNATEPIADLDLDLQAASGSLAGSYDVDTNWEKVAYTNTTSSARHLMLRVYGYSISSDLNRVENFALACNRPLTPVGTVRGDFADFDEDGDKDQVIFRPGNGKWFARDTGGVTVSGTQWGMAGDVPVPGEWHAGSWYVCSDICVWRPENGTWFMRGIGAYSWGVSGDVPVPGNYDGGSGTDFGVYRPSSGNWYIRQQPSGGTFTKSWGLSYDIPVPSDYGGTYVNTDLGVWRPSDGRWYVFELYSNNVLSTVPWGTYGDVPVPGDYNGDTVAELGIFRPWTGEWFIRNISGSYIRVVSWGTEGDIPMPMDYNGDGNFDLCVFRPSNGYWFCRQVDSAAGITTFNWGTYTDIVSGTHHR